MVQRLPVDAALTTDPASAQLLATKFVRFLELGEQPTNQELLSYDWESFRGSYMESARFARLS